jgi:hypothetical protein
MDESQETEPGPVQRLSASILMMPKEFLALNQASNELSATKQALFFVQLFGVGIISVFASLGWGLVDAKQRIVYFGFKFLALSFVYAFNTFTLLVLFLRKHVGVSVSASWGHGLVFSVFLTVLTGGCVSLSGRLISSLSVAHVTTGIVYYVYVLGKTNRLSWRDMHPLPYFLLVLGLEMPLWQLGFSLQFGNVFFSQTTFVQVVLCCGYPVAVGVIKLVQNLLLYAKHEPSIATTISTEILSVFLAAIPYRIIFLGFSGWLATCLILLVEIVYKVSIYALALSPRGFHAYYQVCKLKDRCTNVGGKSKTYSEVGSREELVAYGRYLSVKFVFQSLIDTVAIFGIWGQVYLLNVKSGVDNVMLQLTGRYVLALCTEVLLALSMSRIVAWFSGDKTWTFLRHLSPSCSPPIPTMSHALFIIKQCFGQRIMGSRYSRTKSGWDLCSL